jgi:hypothetical protein
MKNGKNVADSMHLLADIGPSPLIRAGFGLPATGVIRLVENNGFAAIGEEDKNLNGISRPGGPGYFFVFLISPKALISTKILPCITAN